MLDYKYIIDSREYVRWENPFGEEKGTSKYVREVKDIKGKEFSENIFEY